MILLKRSAWWRRIARRLGRELFRVAENNDEPRIDRNGERWLLRELVKAHVRHAEMRPFVAIDAGGNRGDYTRVVLQTAQAAGCAVEIHIVEPSPACVAILRESFAGAQNVRIVAAALGDYEGEAGLHEGKSGSSQASLMMRPGFATDAANTIAVPIIRIADYIAQARLTHIDLLKLDVEGSELAALRGMGEFLRPDFVDMIQVEYGGTTLDARVSLRDIYGLLEAGGYVMTKLLPTALEARSYRPWMEHFSYANYVAVSPRWQSEAGRSA
jgi:FkbM family methyltransferase